MRTIVIDGEKHVIDCNAFTPFVYSENFTTIRDGRKVSDDIAVAIKEIFDLIDTVGFPPLLRMMQLFWAFEKSARPQATPSFKDWLKSLPPLVVNLDDEDGWASEVMEEIRCSFFRNSSKADVEAETEQTQAATVS